MPSIAAVNGAALTIKFFQKVAHAYTDTKDAAILGSLFTVMKSSAPISVTNAVVNGDTVTLTLASAIAHGDAGITVEYEYATGNTQGIGFLDSANSNLPTVWLGFGTPPVTVANNTPNPSSGGGDTTPTPTPPSNTTPTNVSTTIGGTAYPAGRQPDGTFLITVPHGTDISNLTIGGTLPAGATSVPKLPASHDFTEGPLEIVVTAQDGKTKVTHIVKVLVEEPAGPTEKPLFTINVADCEIVVTQNADGTLSVKVRIPFAASSNPALLDTVKMIASSLGLANVSYGIVNADGSETPVARMAASAPYLEIRGTAANRDAIENGVVTKIEYTLKGDNGLYAQTFANGGLKLADMPGYPSPEPTPSGGGSSSGCDAGLLSGAGLAAVALAGALLVRRRKQAA